MSDKTGGAAFPKAGLDPWGMAKELNVGMTLRDYFAAKAMQGICAHHDTWGLLIQDIADRSYEIADAMLSDRAK